MDSLIGITGKDFVLLASGLNEYRSILVMKHDQEKMYQLSKNVMILSSGEGCQASRFSQFIQRDFQLYYMRNGFNLSTYSVAKLTRSQIAQSLRTRSPILVDVLVAGTDPKTETPELYWIDHIGTFCKMPYAAHGYTVNFVLSIMDKHWHSNIDLETACSIMKKCIAEINKRFVIQQPKFKVRVIDKEGTKDLEI